MTTRIYFHDRHAAVAIAESIEAEGYEVVVITERTDNDDEQFLVATPAQLSDLDVMLPDDAEVEIAD